jgi:hypothetical protein
MLHTVGRTDRLLLGSAAVGGADETHFTKYMEGRVPVSLFSWYVFLHGAGKSMRGGRFRRGQKRIGTGAASR